MCRYQKLDLRMKGRYQDPKVAIIDDQNRGSYGTYGYPLRIYSVNGVAALHTDILKHSELKPFYDIYPEKFNNKTNGITFRRWLLHCNRELTAWIEKRIGSGFKENAEELEGLMAFAGDERGASKSVGGETAKKQELADYLEKTQGLILDPQSIYDIQIKRLPRVQTPADECTVRYL